MTFLKSFRTWLWLAAAAALCFTAMLTTSCNTSGEDGHTFLKVHVDTSWLGYDSVQVLLDRGDGSKPEKIFGGKVVSPADLERIQADGYDGGKVSILIVAFDDGLVAREENRKYDGSAQKTVEVVIVKAPDKTPVESKDGLHMSLSPSDTLISIGDSVPFTAQCRNDSGLLAKADWDFEGDGAADLSVAPATDLATLKAGHRYAKAGVFHPGVTLKGAKGAVLLVEVTVTVVADKPIADAGPDTTLPVSTDLVLTGTARDALGRIVKQEWRIGGGAFSETPDGKVSFKTPAVAGDVKAVFRVTDDDSLTAEDTAVVHVTAPKDTSKDSTKDALHLSLTPKDTVISIRDSVAFLAIAKNDNGKIAKEEWDLDGDGTLDLTRNPGVDSAALRAGFRFPKAGTYSPAVVITGAKGATLTASATVKVIEDRPGANAGPDQTVLTGSTVLLSGTGKDSLGRIVKQEWSIAADAYAVTADGKVSFTAPALSGTVKAVYRVTDDDDLTAEDTVAINVIPPAVANLTALSVQGCALAPAFHPDSLAYACVTPYGTASVAVTAKAQGDMTLNGKALADGKAGDAVALVSGSADLALAVANGADSKNYAIKVTSATASGNNALKALSVSAGALVPVFAANQAAYDLTVASTVASLTVTATLEDSTASLFIQGVNTLSGAPSAAIALSPGANPIAITITAQNGSKRTGTITVTRQSGEAALKTLTVSAGTLTPAFAQATTAYALSVGQATASLNLTAAAADAKAAVTLNGSALEANKATALALTQTVTTATLVVTAEDNAIKRTYTVTVTKIDDVPPSAPTLALGTFAAPDRPTWTWAPGGGGNGTYRYKLDDANLTAGALTSSSLSYSATADLAGGSHILYVQERDSAGNWSASGQATATLATLKPIADYSLAGHAMDSLGNGDLALLNAPYLSQGIYSNGLYGTAGAVNVITPGLSGFVTTNFSMEVDFKPDAITGAGQPIVVGGSSFRWLGGVLDATGKVGLSYNNNGTVVGTQTCTAGWHTLKLEYVGGVARAYLDGVLSASVTATLSFGGDYNFGPTNFSNGGTFKGYLRNLRVYASGARIAQYPLCVDAKDIAKKQTDMTVENAPFQVPGPGISLAGIYPGGGAGGTEAATPALTNLNLDDFAIKADFSIDALPASRIPVVVGGQGSRWIGALIEPSGNLTLLYNNSLTFATTLNCSLAAKHTVSIRFSAASQMASLYLDGVLAGSKSIPSLTHLNEKTISTTNYSNGSAFKGNLYRLKVESK